MTTVTVKKTKSAVKTVEPKEPAKKKISKLGQMMDSYKGKIIEHGNVWDL